MENKFCSNCGSPLGEGQEVCLSCGKVRGKPQSKTNAKKQTNIIIIAIVAAILVFGSVIGGGVFLALQKEKKIEQYKTDASSFNFLVITSLADIESVGNDISSYWRDYIYNNKYTSVDDAVGRALLKNDSLIDTIDDNKERIEEEYEKLLKLPDKNNTELIEIKDAIEELYDEYLDFYDAVITPSGNYTSFRTKFTSLDESAVEKYDKLKSLLD